MGAVIARDDGTVLVLPSIPRITVEGVRVQFARANADSVARSRVRFMGSLQCFVVADELGQVKRNAIGQGEVNAPTLMNGDRVGRT